MGIVYTHTEFILILFKIHFCIFEPTSWDMAFMVFWNDNLDITAMINLVICCSHFLCICFQFRALSKLKSHWSTVSARLPCVTKCSLNNNRGMKRTSSGHFLRLCFLWCYWSCSWSNFYPVFLTFLWKWVWIASNKPKANYRIPDWPNPIWWKRTIKNSQ